MVGPVEDLGGAQEEDAHNLSEVSIVVSEDDESLNHHNGVESQSPKKPQLSRNPSSQEQCRVCQQEKEEDLINLGCHCRGDLARAHQSCISTWFNSRGSNTCEICQQVASNVVLPESQESGGCLNPLWIAFSILIGGLLLDVLISISLGVTALPVNIIIGVIIVLGLGTAIRLALEFCYNWSVRRAVHGVEANASLGYQPPL